MKGEPCVICGGRVAGGRGPVKTCSRPCRRAHRSIREIVRAQASRRVFRVRCGWCRRTFMTTKPAQRFDTRDCATARHLADLRSHTKPPHLRTCEACLRPYLPRRNHPCNRFCRTCAVDREQMQRSMGGNHRRRARRFGRRYEVVHPFDIFSRDGWRCQVCGRSTPRRHRGTHRPNAPELDHRVPMSRGGDHIHTNLQTACRACNASKGGRKIVGQLPLWERGVGGSKSLNGGLRKIDRKSVV